MGNRGLASFCFSSCGVAVVAAEYIDRSDGSDRTVGLIETML